MNNKIQVKKQNSLVDAIYRLSLNETRIFNYAIAKTDYKLHCYDNITYFTLSEIKKFYSLNSNNTYKEFKKALDDLFERQITYYDEDKKGYITCRIITHKYEDKEIKLGLRFSEEISELIAVNKNFLTYKLKSTVGMTSPSAIRIYEILLHKLKKKTSKVTIGVEEFKKILGFSNKEYSKFSDFKRRVLEVARKQINKHTDITFDFFVEKYGTRSAIDLIFVSSFKKKNDINENDSNSDKSIPKDDHQVENNNLLSIASDQKNNIPNFEELFSEATEISLEDRKMYIKLDLKEYIGIDDFMINKYLKDYKNKLDILEQQIRETLDADEKGKIIKSKASHFSYYLKFKS